MVITEGKGMLSKVVPFGLGFLFIASVASANTEEALFTVDNEMGSPLVVKNVVLKNQATSSIIENMEIRSGTTPAYTVKGEVGAPHSQQAYVQFDLVSPDGGKLVSVSARADGSGNLSQARHGHCSLLQTSTDLLIRCKK